MSEHEVGTAAVPQAELSRLVCLHGFTGSCASWNVFRRLLDQRAPERGPQVDVFTPNLSGHADAPRAASFEAEVERLWSAVDQRWSPSVRVTLVGYSLGARVALRMMSARPERVRAALFIGVHPGLGNEAERRARRAADARWIELLEVGGLEAFARAWQALPLFATQKELPVSMREAQNHIRSSHRADGLAHSLRTVGLAEMPESGHLLRDPPVPLLVLVGALDTKFRKLLEETISSRVQSGPTSATTSAQRRILRVIPDVGHNVLLERPTSVVDALFELLLPPSADESGSRPEFQRTLGSEQIAPDLSSKRLPEEHSS